MYRIGEVAKRLGLTARAIRHYQDIGLVKPGYVAENNYRYYTEEDIVLLDSIAALARLGVPLVTIKEMLEGLEREGLDAVGRVRRLLARQLAAVEDELARLDEIRKLINQADFALELNQEKPLELVTSIALTLEKNRANRAQWQDRWDFDRQADSYDQVTGRPVAGYDPHENYQDVLGFVAGMFSSGDEVLDVGIGTGNLSATLIRQGCQVLGIDQSKEMLRQARQKLGSIRLLEANMLALPLADQGVEGVASTYAIHHLPDQEKTLALGEMVRVLKPGGRLVIGDNMFYDDAAREKTRIRLGEAGLDDDWEAIQDEYLATVTFLCQELEAQGLRVGYKQMAAFTWVVWADKN